MCYTRRNDTILSEIKIGMSGIELENKRLGRSIRRKNYHKFGVTAIYSSHIDYWSRLQQRSRPTRYLLFNCLFCGFGAPLRLVVFPTLLLRAFILSNALKMGSL